MSHSLHRPGNGLFVYDAAGIKGYFCSEPFQDHALENLHLHLSHNLHMNLLGSLAPYQMKLRYLLLQLSQLFIHHMDVALRGQNNPIGQHRFQQRKGAALLRSQPLTAAGFLQARHRAYRPRRSLLGQFISRSGIDSDLICLFLPDFLLSLAVDPASFQNLLDFQASPRHLHPGKPGSLAVPGNLINSGSKFIAVLPGP